MIPPIVEDVSYGARRARAGELPSRYADPWLGPFVDRLRPALTSANTTILDVGSGRRPTIPRAWRASHTHYVGLDLAREELDAAETGSYDEILVSDIGSHASELEGQFDLIVSWQVLEHVEDLGASLRNMHSYLRQGGRMVALLSGSYAIFALMSRVIPHRVNVSLMTRFLGAQPEDKFKTHYDKCSFRALDAALSEWRDHEVVPLYRGATYFSPWRPLERAYVAYEDWLVRTQRANLATHYLIVGDR
jgi:SAM-dependent methyltransferase